MKTGTAVGSTSATPAPRADERERRLRLVLRGAGYVALVGLAILLASATVRFASVAGCMSGVVM